MRAIVLSLLLAFAMWAADADPTASIAKLTTALSANDSVNAIAYFDKNLPNYHSIEANLEALAAQSSVGCAIDVVTDEEANGVHKMDLDWYMTIASQADPMQLERRRERVHVEMRKFGDRWKIISIAPVSILDPMKLP